MSGDPKERPIIFKAEMVRAILDGKKTQTRRVIKVQPESHGSITWAVRRGNGVIERWWRKDADGQCLGRGFGCPYGEALDRLWVKETWAQNENQISESKMDTSIVYRATDGRRALDNGVEKAWSPSIFMPRWASRITLEITGVRVERVQEIGEGDALAEGVDCEIDHAGPAFIELWDSINSKRGFGWDENPWVWVVEFKRCQ